MLWTLGIHGASGAALAGLGSEGTGEGAEPRPHLAERQDQFFDRCLSDDQDSTRDDGGEDHECTPGAKRSPERKRHQRSDRATAIPNDFHRLGQRDCAGQKMEDRKRAGEHADGAQRKPTRTVGAPPERHRESDADEDGREGIRPHTEEKLQSGVEEAPDGACLPEERESDDDGEDDEDHSPYVVGLTAEALPQEVPGRLQREAACAPSLGSRASGRPRGRLLGLLLCVGHPFPPTAALPGGCLGSHVPVRLPTSTYESNDSERELRRGERERLESLFGDRSSNGLARRNDRCRSTEREELSGLNRDVQPVAGRRQRAGPDRIPGARGVECIVEVEDQGTVVRIRGRRPSPCRAGIGRRDRSSRSRWYPGTG